ncbi:MAG TPA: 2-oxo acid dehydrogenase subunit E2, partial [Myxococcales bacterium]|nr:2-oxo acid dehydrogenase subunit E2 [Myxococcales bacterium]
MDVLVPDLGDFKDIPVLEVLVKVGDEVQAEQSLVTLESDKATMEVPAPAAGVIKEMKLKAGDKVSKGTVVCVLEEKSGGAAEKKPAEEKKKPSEQAQPTPRKDHGGPTETVPPPPRTAAPIDEEGFRTAHAGPGVRKLARELGVDLGKVKGTGPKDRILPEDLHAFVKTALTTGAPAAAAAAPLPKIDFSKFGPVEDKPLTRIQKIAGPALLRNWNAIPHVTSCEDADITELESFRVALNKEQTDVKVTLLAFLVKACIASLKKFPNFNSSLDGDHLVLKRYYNIAFAADTPQGLVVPVIKDADKKGVLAIAKEAAELSAKARDGKLLPGDMQGASFTISSLGGIGGTYFTPIINAPEVAILGVCKAAMRPVWDGNE